MPLYDLARFLPFFSTVENARGIVEAADFPIFHTPCKGVEKWKEPQEENTTKPTSPRQSGKTSMKHDEIDDALEHTGQILDILGRQLAVTSDARLLILFAALECVGDLQDRLFDLRTS
jgi:hypothetical protein